MQVTFLQVTFHDPGIFSANLFQLENTVWKLIDGFRITIK